MHLISRQQLYINKWKCQISKLFALSIKMTGYILQRNRTSSLWLKCSEKTISLTIQNIATTVVLLNLNTKYWAARIEIVSLAHWNTFLFRNLATILWCHLLAAELLIMSKRPVRLDLGLMVLVTFQKNWFASTLCNWCMLSINCTQKTWSIEIYRRATWSSMSISTLNLLTFLRQKNWLARRVWIRIMHVKTGNTALLKSLKNNTIVKKQIGLPLELLLMSSCSEWRHLEQKIRS